MSQFARISHGRFAGVAGVAGAAFVGWVLLTACGTSAPPTRKPTSTDIAIQPAGNAERGAILAAVFSCQACHSQRVADGVTLAPATIMAGGRPFQGPWGLVHSANVTEIARAFDDDNLSKVIRGQVLSLHVMPTTAYNGMAADDMRDLIAYLRTLKPVSYDAPANDFKADYKLPPLNAPVPVPATAPVGATAARGKYLVTMAGCADCHTPADANGQPDATRTFAGGTISIQDKQGRTVRPPNLTPDKATGLGDWSDAEIADAIRLGKRRGGGQLNPFMPYATAFHAFTDEDVAAVIAYLRSLPAVSNDASPNPPYEP